MVCAMCSVAFWLHASVSEEYSASIFIPKDGRTIFLRNISTQLIATWRSVQEHYHLTDSLIRRFFNDTVAQVA